MAEHNFLTQGPKAYYNAKGKPYWCSSKDDVAKAKELGFTSANYVRSEWPKTAYHKKTGATRTVGSLDNTDEQNAAAVVTLGPDWGLEHVHVPEVVPEKEKAAVQDSSALMLILDKLSRLERRMDRIEDELGSFEPEKPVVTESEKV